MKLIMSATCIEPNILLSQDFPADRGSTLGTVNYRRPKDKVVFLMGPTGTGKTRLSIDLASSFPSEIINSDKIQVHSGLQIVTNKITQEEARGIPHHLLGVLPPFADFTASDFSRSASSAAESILNRGKLPIVVGGSNSFAEALVDGHGFGKTHDCLFLCVHASPPVLRDYVSERVDKMVQAGMVDEVREFLDSSDTDYKRGIGRAIGVPEFDRFFRMEPLLDRGARERKLREVIVEIKRNTNALACRQMDKIERLQRKKRWNIRMIDATEVFLSRGRGGGKYDAWESVVAGPSTDVVARFFRNAATSSRRLARYRSPVGSAERVVQCLAA